METENSSIYNDDFDLTEGKSLTDSKRNRGGETDPDFSIYDEDFNHIEEHNSIDNSLNGLKPGIEGEGYLDDFDNSSTENSSPSGNANSVPIPIQVKEKPISIREQINEGGNPRPFDKREYEDEGNNLQYPHDFGEDNSVNKTEHQLEQRPRAKYLENENQNLEEVNGPPDFGKTKSESLKDDSSEGSADEVTHSRGEFSGFVRFLSSNPFLNIFQDKRMGSHQRGEWNKLTIILPQSTCATRTVVTCLRKYL